MLKNIRFVSIFSSKGTDNSTSHKPFSNNKGFVVTAIIFDLIETLVIAGAIFVVIYAFLFRPYQVNGHSMDPTYQNGEYILTNLITLKFNKLTRGDVVVFKAPLDAEKDYIKRIIGLPGDTVMIKEGYVYVNNQKLDESAYLPPDFRTYGGQTIVDGELITVPNDNYIVFGDNRGGSSDSREWGFVPKDKIIGKSAIVYWPLTEFHFIRTPKYSL